jgi:hypothetical protein
MRGLDARRIDLVPAAELLRGHLVGEGRAASL